MENGRGRMTDIAQTAADYFDRYKSALDDHTLVQGVWNSEQDGRHVACALGVLGPDVDSVSDCPASVMPRWLAQMVPWLFDAQSEEEAFAWGLDFAAELKRLDGQVPFTVVYDWQGNHACQLGIEVAEKRGRSTEPHKALQALHRKALAGEKSSVEEWRKTLRDANAYANAYAYAYANAYAYAYAYANANAYAYAYANANDYAYKKAINRLAVGLVGCMARVPAGQVAA
jgi:hypothetical protein